MTSSKSKKKSLQLDLSLSTFETQCHVVNDLLMSKNLLLRAYELGKKFHYLTKKLPQGKNIIQKDLSVCVEIDFNGFELVRRITENELRQLHRPVNIVYKPISRIDQIINCYFPKSMRNVCQELIEKEAMLNLQLQISAIHATNFL